MRHAAASSRAARPVTTRRRPRSPQSVLIIGKRLTIRGFIVSDSQPSRRFTQRSAVTSPTASAVKGNWKAWSARRRRSSVCCGENIGKIVAHDQRDDYQRILLSRLAAGQHIERGIHSSIVRAGHQLSQLEPAFLMQRYQT